jgi:hypothetical protein
MAKEIYDKMLSVTNHTGNEHQNHHKVSPYNYQNGWYQKTKDKRSWQR